jgi:GT2 family glycosyltransferase
LTPFVDATPLEKVFRNSSLMRAFHVADRPSTAVQDVDWLVGACLCARRACLAEAGLFDEGYFMYSEEVDLCRRVRAAGWRISYRPDAQVVHHEGKSSEQNVAARAVRFHTSRFRYLRRYHSRLTVGVLRWWILALYLVQAAVESTKLALGHRPALRRERVRALRVIIQRLFSAATGRAVMPI